MLSNSLLSEQPESIAARPDGTPLGHIVSVSGSMAKVLLNDPPEGSGADPIETPHVGSVLTIDTGATLVLCLVAAAVIAGGVAGNLLDRVIRGNVIDFIRLHGWPVFNVADVALVVGAGLLMIGALRTRPGGAAPPPASA